MESIRRLSITPLEGEEYHNGKQTKYGLNNGSKNSLIEIVENDTGCLFPEDFLTMAAKKAQESPNLLHIDEWNASSRKLHSHGAVTIDDKWRMLMDSRCKTKSSKISDILNDSILSSSIDFDTEEELLGEMTSETFSASRRLLLTVSQGLDDHQELQTKQFVITFDDAVDLKNDTKVDGSIGMINDVEHKDNDESFQNMH